MNELDAMMKTLRYAGYEVMTRRQATELRSKKMLLSDVIKVWDAIHMNDCGEMGFADLERAIDAVVGVENDCASVEVSSQPSRLLSEAAPSNIGFQRTSQAAPSTVLDGFMEQQGETARR